MRQKSGVAGAAGKRFNPVPVRCGGEQAPPVLGVYGHPKVIPGGGINALDRELNRESHAGLDALRRASRRIQHPDFPQAASLAAERGDHTQRLRLVVGRDLPLLPLHEVALVLFDHLLGRAAVLDPSVVQPDRAIAEARNQVHGVGAEQYRAPILLEPHHAVEALLLESAVAHRKRLIHHEDAGVHVGCHGKSQSRDHARRVRAQRLVNELAQVGEREHVAEALLHGRFLDPEQGPVEEGILAPREV